MGKKVYTSLSYALSRSFVSRETKGKPHFKGPTSKANTLFTLLRGSQERHDHCGASLVDGQNSAPEIVRFIHPK